MAETELQEARRRFNEVSQRVRSNGDNWAEFLTCAARNHKYEFQDQLLIFDQRPDATACADLNLWKNHFNRSVEKETKSIKLLRSNAQSVFNVFDISDTRPDFGHEFDEPPYVWQIEPEDFHDVSEQLNQAYGFSSELERQLAAISRNFAQNLERNGDSLYSSVSTSEDRRKLTDLLSNSLEYYLRTRCGLEIQRENFSFENISGLDANTAMRLGTITSGFSRQVLDNIERVVRANHERRKLEHGQSRNFADSVSSELHDGRGIEASRRESFSGIGNEAGGGHGNLSRSGVDPIRESGLAGGQSDEGNGGRNDLRESSEHLDSVPNAEIKEAAATPDEVRTNEAEIFRRVESSDSLRTGRESTYSLFGDSGAGEKSETRADKPIRAERPAAGQEPRSDGMGATHEQSRHAGRRNRNENSDLQQLDFFSALEEQENVEISSVPEAEKISETPAPSENKPGEPKLIEKVDDSKPQEEKHRKPSQPRINYRISNYDLGVGGAKSKFHNNLEAIKTLKTIESEDRRATPEEQEILSRYVGWGGIPQAFDENNNDWTKEYAELKSILTDGEYNAARGSTLNAHYTSPMVARSIYETIERMGFSKGNILEPSCGIGNFFGILPESMNESKLYGVELDSITGRIARQLYQKAEIKIDGYERAKYPDNFFDVAIGNVPFGSYSVVDSEHKYNQENFRIHDYFFAKTLDKIRPGGVVAFITSKGTLDKINPSVRNYLAQRAELLGAVRLPNNAFKDNAGTEVTTDIIFLQKREQLVDDIQAEWIYTRENEDGIRINNYFANHPEMILGKMVKAPSLYGNENETACEPFEDEDLQEQLLEALDNIQGRIEEREIQTQENIRESIPADPSVRNFSYTLADGELYYRENSLMYKPDLPATAISRAKGMVRVRDACRAVINAQMDGCSDETLAGLQEKLNQAYDSFSRSYGRINDSQNARAFDEDSSYYLICGLENFDANRNFIGKSDMFTKRTIQQNVVPTSVETAQEALLLSISEKARIDMDYMSSLTGKSEEELFSELKGENFKVPNAVMPDNERAIYQTADEYLSGDVRKKLYLAKFFAKDNPEFEENVKALEALQPEELKATDIDVRLGSTWVPSEYVEQFVCELLQTSEYNKKYINVSYSEQTSAWNISGKKLDWGNVLATTTYGTDRINAYEIIEDTLNLKSVKIFKTVLE